MTPEIFGLPFVTFGFAPLLSCLLMLSSLSYCAQVVHYEIPNSSENFVHRSGRTGRAGKKGSAILIYSDHQYRDVKAIEREVGCRFVEVSC